MTARTASAGLAATLALAANLLASHAAADDVEEWKFALYLPATHPNTLQAKEWADHVEEASKGRLKITLYPAQQLGRAADHYELARLGNAEIAHINFGFEPARLPIANVTQIPFLIGNARGGSRAIDQWYRAYAEREMPDVKLCIAFAHDPGTLHARRKITVPEQMRGLRVRASNATMARFIAMLGARAIYVPALETREALEREQIDAITFPYGSLFMFGLDRAVVFHLDLPLYTSTFAWVINRKKYADLAPDLQQAIDAHCTTAMAGRIADAWAKIEASGRERVRVTSGHLVYEVDEQDHAAWRRAAEPLRQQWAASMQDLGLNPNRMLADLQANLERYDAAYPTGVERDASDDPNRQRQPR